MLCALCKKEEGRIQLQGEASEEKKKHVFLFSRSKVNLEDGNKCDDNDDISDEGSVVSVVSHHVVDLGKRAESALFPHGDLSC